jgi:hypothetical protein
MILTNKRNETIESDLTDQEAAEACDRIPEDHKNAKFAYRITHQRTCREGITEDQRWWMYKLAMEQIATEKGEDETPIPRLPTIFRTKMKKGWRMVHDLIEYEGDQIAFLQRTTNKPGIYDYSVVCPWCTETIENLNDIKTFEVLYAECKVSQDLHTPKCRKVARQYLHVEIIKPKEPKNV